MRAYRILRDQYRRGALTHAVLDEDYWAYGEDLGIQLRTVCWKNASVHAGEWDAVPEEGRCPKCVKALARLRVGA